MEELNKTEQTQNELQTQTQTQNEEPQTGYERYLKLKADEEEKLYKEKQANLDRNALNRKQTRTGIFGGPVNWKEEFTLPSIPEDNLILEYPNLGDKIFTALQEGKDRKEIRKRLMRAEAIALMQYSPDEVNKFLGRTNESIVKFIDALHRDNDNFFVELMRDDMPEAQVREILRMSKDMRVAPELLFLSPEFRETVKKKYDEIQPERSWGGTFYASARNAISSYQQSNVEVWKMEADKLRAQLEDPNFLLAEGMKISLNEGVNAENFEEYCEKCRDIAREQLQRQINEYEEMAKTDAADAEAWYTPVRMPDKYSNYWQHMFFNSIANSGFTMKSMLTRSLAYNAGNIVGGLIGAPGLGSALMFITSTLGAADESTREAASAYRENLERFGDRDKALKAANFVKAINLPFLMLSNYGGDYLFETLDKTLFEPLARDILLKPNLNNVVKAVGARFTADFVPGLLGGITEGVEEWGQGWANMHAQGDKIDNAQLRDSFVQGMFSSWIFGTARTSIGNIFDYVNGQRYYQLAKKEREREAAIKNIASQAFEAAQLANKVNAGHLSENDVIEENPVIFIPKSQIDDQTAQALNIQDEVLLDEENKNIEVQEQNEKAEDEDNEVAVRKETWDKFVAENPEKAEALKDVVREGVHGITVAEKINQTAKDMVDIVNKNPALESEVERLTQEFVDAGQPNAKGTAQFLGAIATAINKQYGIDIQQVMNLRAVKGDTQSQTNMQQAETHNQTQQRILSEEKLDADEKAWGESVENVLLGNITEGTDIKVMTTPLVLTFAGAKTLPIYMRAEKINTVINGIHAVDKNIVKQIPQAIADPIAIFTSKTRPQDSIVVMTELIDADGGTVIAAIALDKKQYGYDINFLSSIYAKKDDQTKIPKNQWFADQIKNGLLVYMNTKKSSEWTNQTGLRLPAANTRNGRSIPNEVDLVKLRNQPEYETYYQTSQSDSDNVATLRDFKQAFDKLNENGQTFIRIPDLRKELNWPREVFDSMLIKLRDEGIITLRVGDATLRTLEEVENSFVDENGFRMGTVTWENNNIDLDNQKFDISLSQQKQQQQQEISDPIAALANDILDMFKPDNGSENHFLPINELRDAFNARGFDNETFDFLIETLRDNGTIVLHQSDESIAGAEKAAKFFTDSNGFTFGTFSIENINALMEAVQNAVANEEVISQPNVEATPVTTQTDEISEPKLRKLNEDEMKPISDSLRSALDMAKEKKTSKAIKKATGWEKISDEEWRWTGKNDRNQDVKAAYFPRGNEHRKTKDKFNSLIRYNKAQIKAILEAPAGTKIHQVHHAFATTESDFEITMWRGMSEKGLVRVNKNGSHNRSKKLSRQLLNDVFFNSEATLFYPIAKTAEEIAKDEADLFKTLELSMKQNDVDNTESQVSELTAEITQNIQHGTEAMNKVISDHVDVENAMHRDDIGYISFLYGTPGTGAKLKHGWGISHLIARRNQQGFNGEEIARKMVEVIAKGEITRRYGQNVPNGERLDITYDDYTAILSLYKDKEKLTWLLTGFKNENPVATSEGNGSSSATLNSPMRTRTEEGAGNSVESLAFNGTTVNAEQENINARTSWPKGTSSAETQSLVEFFMNANASTGFHEIAHHVLRVLTDAAQLESASDILLQDVDTILKNAGVNKEDFYNDVGDARETAHEYFAKSFEAYLHEGKAPVKELQSTFDRVKQWLVEVYKNIKESLGIELNDEMRDVFDRLLATPEQLAEQKSISEIDSLYDATETEIQRLQEEINRLTEEYEKKIDDEVLLNTVAAKDLIAEENEKAFIQGKNKGEYYGIKEGREYQKKIDREKLDEEREKAFIKGKNRGEYYGIKDGREYQRKIDREKTAERIAKLRQQQKLMKERQQERQRIKKQSNKLIKAINRMTTAKNVDWRSQEKIGNLLETHDKINRKNYSLRDLEFIHGQVKELYDVGKRERAAKLLADTERVEGMKQELAATMQKDWDKRPKGAVSSSQDYDKQYKGAKGVGKRILDWSLAKTMGAQRFFDYMDNFKKHTGAWVQYFCDMSNAALNEKLLYKYMRIKTMEDAMKQLQITNKTLSERRNIDVPHKSGKGWKVQELIGIYAGLKNEHSREAILFGNFSHAESYEQAVEWAAKAVEALKPNEKALGDFVIQEYEENFPRLKEKIGNIWNIVLNHEENYTAMRRLEFSSSSGGLHNPDAGNLDSVLSGITQGYMGRVERGFAESRVNFKQNAQPGIDLNIISVWYSQVEAQEHAMAFGQLVKDLRRVLIGKSENAETTIREMVRETRGKYAWEMIKQYFNIIATNDTQQAYDALDDIARYLAKNMSIAYLCGNLGTALKQMNSLAFVLPYAGPTHIINSIGQFLSNPQAFMEECYNLDPQLRARNGDPFIQELRKESGAIYDALLKHASAPIGMVDRMTSCIVFKAVYNANIKKGLSHDDAVKQAQRVVLLTQPPSHIKDKPLVWQQHGYGRLAMMFTNSLSQIYGITLYDLTSAIARGEVPTVLATLTGLTLAGMMIKGLSSGDDDDNDTLAERIFSALGEQTVNSIPVVGKGLLSLWDYWEEFFKKDSSPFVAPFAKLASGKRGLWDEKDNNDERAIWTLIEGGSLFAPFPVTALRRLYYTGKELGQGEIANALKRLVGMHVEEKKYKKAAGFR